MSQTTSTEWDDALVKFGIKKAPEKEISEEQIVDLMESTIQQRSQKQVEDLSLEELEELEDEFDPIVDEYRYVMEISDLSAKQNLG